MIGKLTIVNEFQKLNKWYYYVNSKYSIDPFSLNLKCGIFSHFQTTYRDY